MSFLRHSGLVLLRLRHSCFVIPPDIEISVSLDQSIYADCDQKHGADKRVALKERAIDSS